MKGLYATPPLIPLYFNVTSSYNFRLSWDRYTCFVGYSTIELYLLHMSICMYICTCWLTYMYKMPEEVTIDLVRGSLIKHSHRHFNLILNHFYAWRNTGWLSRKLKLLSYFIIWKTNKNRRENQCCGSFPDIHISTIIHWFHVILTIFNKLYILRIKRIKLKHCLNIFLRNIHYLTHKKWPTNCDWQWHIISNEINIKSSWDTFTLIIFPLFLLIVAC